MPQDRGLCLLKSSYVGELPDGRYVEKFIVDVYTGNPIAKYAELNGTAVAVDHEGNPINHTLEEFNTVADDLFPRQEN